MTVDLTEYKQIEDSNYYINKEGLIYNNIEKKLINNLFSDINFIDYKQIKDSNYYINKEGLVYNNKLNKFLKTKNNGASVEISINKKSKSFSIKNLVSELFSDIDLNEYKQIPDSNYYVNKFGKILNKFGKEVKPRITNNGYSMFSIGLATVYVHRAVALAFLPNTNNLPDVHHKDNNKSNNKLDNLEWVTRSANCRMYNKKKNNGLPRGVSWNKSIKKYQTQISIDCKVKHLGYFNTPEEASEKYRKVYKEVMGFECEYN